MTTIAPQGTSPTSKKINVVVSGKDYEKLDQLAKEQGLTVSQVVREALRIGVWYQKEIAANNRQLLVRDNDGGEIRQLVKMGT